VRQTASRFILCSLVPLSISACATTRQQPEPQPIGTSGTATVPPSVPTTAAPDLVPVGQQLDVRLQSRLSSDTAKTEDRFDATTVVDLRQDSSVLIPAGSVVHGVVTAVDPATRTDRTGSLTLSFDRITVRGRSYPIRALAIQVFESEGLEGEAARIAAGAGVGAILGGILGGVKGALAGILIGGGGVVAATEGKEPVLPAGTTIRIRFDAPLQLRSQS